MTAFLMPKKYWMKTKFCTISDFAHDPRRTHPAQMKRSHKYRAQAVVCPETGDRFDSKSEYSRWLELRFAQERGDIADLKRQVPYPLSCGHQPVLIRSPRYKNGRQVKYVADFVYTENGETVVEDRKGYWTADAKLKVAFFEAQYGKRVRITGAAA